jgi:hypothetical protein
MRAGRVAPFPASARIRINGQSNCLGVAARSELSESPLSADAGLAEFDADQFDRVLIWVNYLSQYQALKIGTNNMAYTSSTFGPEFGLAVRWMRETTSGILYIDKWSADGSAIASWRDGQTNFEDMQTRYGNASSWLSFNSVTPAADGWVWVQGESDRLQTQSYYYDELTALQAERVAAGISPSGEKRVIAQMVSGTTHYSAAIVAAKTQFVGETANASEITFAPYMNGDNLHLNARGQLQLGYDAFSALFGAAPLEA